MGILSKAWKGIKSIGSGIVKRVKKTIKSIGKFVNKIGIAGQIALSLMLPGAGELFGALTKTMMDTTMKGVLGSVVRGAGQFLNVGVKLGNRVGNVFKSLSKGVTDLVGNTIQSTINALPEPLAAGIRNITEKLSFGKLQSKELAKASFGDTFDLAGKIFTNTGTALKDVFKGGVFDGSYNKFSQAIADKQSAALGATQEGLDKITTDDVVKNVNANIDTPAEINRTVTLDPMQETTMDFSPPDLVTDPEAQLNTISKPVSNELLTEEANRLRLSTQKAPVPGVGSGPLGGPSAPSFKTDFETMRTGYDVSATDLGGATEALGGQAVNLEPLKEIEVLAKPVGQAANLEQLKEIEVLAQRRPRSILDRDIPIVDKSLRELGGIAKEAAGEAVLSTGESVIKGLGMKAFGLGPKPAQYTSSSFVFNPDFSRATGIGLETQAASPSMVAQNNFIDDYKANNFDFMNEYPYGFNAYMHYAHREQQRNKGVVG